MKNALRVERRDRGDDVYEEEQDASIEVDLLTFRLPSRQFEISYQLAEEARFSLTTEFLLRLLKAIDVLSEEEIAEFFGFSLDEVAYVAGTAERAGYVTRSGGKVRLSESGDSKFEGSAEEPLLYKVERKSSWVSFDLISFCPLRPDSLAAFERTLPEIQVPDSGKISNASVIVREAFRKHFQEIQTLRGDKKSDRSTIYSIDQVIGGKRTEALVPVSVKVGRDAPTVIEPDLMEWKSGIDLENRIDVLSSCAATLKHHVVGSSFIDSEGISYLQKCAPAYFVRYIKQGIFDGNSFFRFATSQAGDLRADRKTARIYGSLWVKRNSTKLLTAARDYASLPDQAKKRPIIWVRPDIPYWGCSTRLSDLVDGLAKYLAPDGAEQERECVLLAHDNDSPWRFRDIFDSVCTFRQGRVPRNFEMLLVPGQIFAALVHVPLASPQAYPMPLGIISFDPEMVEKAQEVMADIVRSGQPKQRKHDQNVDCTSAILENFE